MAKSRSLTGKSRRRNWRMVMVLLFPMAFAVPGCGGFRIVSKPRGADVLVDGQAVGWKTPVGVRPGQLASGRHEITVSFPGHRVVETPWQVDVSTSTWKIVGAILLPIPFLFTGIGSGFKSTSVGSMRFTLVPVGSTRGDAAVPGSADRRTIGGRRPPDPSSLRGPARPSGL